MVQLIKDNKLQEKLEKDGFVLLPGFLSQPEIQQHIRFFQSSQKREIYNVDNGFYYSFASQEDTYRKELLSNYVYDALKPHLRHHLPDCRAFLGGFLVKLPGDNSYTVPHQDWTTADLAQGGGITLWIPLVDTSEENGAMGFIRGSHQLFEQIVGAPNPDFKTPLHEHANRLFHQLEWVPMKAGDAIVFYKNTVHGSSFNRSGQPRYTMGISLNHKDTPFYLYYLVPGSVEGPCRKIARIRVDQEFFLKFNNEGLLRFFRAGALPGDYPAEEVIEQQYQSLDWSHVESFLQESGTGEKPDVVA